MTAAGSVTANAPRPVPPTGNSNSRPWYLSGRFISLAIAIAGFFLGLWAPTDNLSPAGHRMLAIFILSIVLWVTEAIPMHATAVAVMLLMVLMLSNAGFMSMPQDYKPMLYGDIFASLSNPVIILFLGGFFLADGAAKYKLDQNLSRIVLKPFGTRPAMILMGMMLITAIFSMFMSNTATTATMMTVALPVIAQFPDKDRFKIALALSIPVAANIGGIGTPIGTPPNAIALGALSAANSAGKALGHVPTFMQWTIGAVPFMLVFLAISWLILVIMFRSHTKHVELKLGQAKFDRSWQAKIFYATFIITVSLWMTESLHGLNSNVVGFIPVVVLLSARVFSVKDLQNLDWHVLWLVAGGIALGLGIGKTGMDSWFIGLFKWDTMGAGTLVAVLSLASLTMGTFISHSATANLLIPLGISLAMSLGTISPITAAIFIAVGSSLAMALPISTPPNAIAFATGQIKVHHMAVTGILIGLISWAIFIVFAPPLWRLVGILPPITPIATP